MDTRAAYDAILRAVAADPNRRLVESVYDEDIFGNFVVAYNYRGALTTVLNDRGELVGDDPTGEASRVTLVPLISDLDEDSLLRALGLLSASQSSFEGLAPRAANDC